MQNRQEFGGIVLMISIFIVSFWVSQTKLAAGIEDESYHLDTIREADKVLAQEPNNTKALYDKADALYNLGRTEDKKNGFNVYLAHSPDYNDKTRSAIMRYQEALNYFGKIVQINPNLEFNSSKLSNIKFKGNSEKSCNVFSDDLYGYRQRALEGIGTSLDGLGKHEEAIKYYDYEIGINDCVRYTSSALHSKGLALASLGHYEEAIKNYEKSMEIGGTKPSTLANIGISLANLGQYEEAIKNYDKGLDLITKDDAVYKFLIHDKGLALANLGQYEEAIKYYDQALDGKRTPSFKMITLNDKGAALSKLGHYEEAIKNYDEALSTNPNFKDALYNKAVTLGKMGETVKAIEYYNKVLELEPSDTDALNNKFIELTKISPDLNPINEKTSGIWHGQYVYISTTQNASIYSDEMQKLKSEVEKNPKNYKLLVIYGKNLESGKHFQDAIIIYKKALDVNPSYLQALIQMGELMIKMGDASGKNYIDSAKKIDPSIENYVTLDELSSPERFSVSETVWQ